MILTTNIFLVNQFQAAVCCCGDPRPYSSIPVFFSKKEKSKGFISLQGKKSSYSQIVTRHSGFMQQVKTVLG